MTRIRGLEFFNSFPDPTLVVTNKKKPLRTSVNEPAYSPNGVACSIMT
jgi:hypothetical protein